MQNYRRNKTNHPNIYNKAHLKHYDRLKKEASFDEIGEIIGQPGKFYSTTKKDVFVINFYVIYNHQHGTNTLTSNKCLQMNG